MIRKYINRPLVWGDYNWIKKLPRIPTSLMCFQALFPSIFLMTHPAVNQTESRLSLIHHNPRRLETKSQINFFQTSLLSSKFKASDLFVSNQMKIVLRLLPISPQRSQISAKSFSLFKKNALE
jgi:hypothetical protein